MLTPEIVFRRYQTAGVPDSGTHDPKKSEIIQLLNMLFGVSRGGWVVARTLTELNSITPPNATDGGVVLAGVGAGYYDREGAAWVFGRGFPDTFAKVTLAGSGEAQTGAVKAGVNPAVTEVFFAQVLTPNTGPLTLSIDGGSARSVINIAGNPLTTGEWTGMVMFFLNNAGQYQLLIDAGAAAAAAFSASEAHEDADRAEAARDVVVAIAGALSVYGTDTSAVGPDGAEVLPVGAVFTTNGRAEAGDGGGGRWKVTGSDPGNTAKLNLYSSGKWGKSLERVLRPEQFGVVFGSPNQEQGFIDLASELRWRGGGRVEFPDNKIADVFGSTMASSIRKLMDISGTRGLKMSWNGSRIVTSNPLASDNEYLRMVYGLDVRGFVANDPDFRQTAQFGLFQSRGIEGFIFEDECIGIEVHNHHQEGGSNGLAFRFSPAFDFQRQAREILHSADYFTTYYGANFQFSGHQYTGKITSRNGGRSYFPFNVRQHEVDIVSAHGGPFQDVLIKCYVDDTKPAVFNDISDIKVSYKTDGRYSGASGGESLIHLAFQQVNATYAVGSMKNISIVLDVQNESFSTAPIQTVLTTGKNLGAPNGNANDTVARGYKMHNIDVSGYISTYGLALFDKTIDMFANAGVSPGDFTGESVTSIRFHDLRIDGADTFAINAACVDSGFVLENVYAPDSPLLMGTAVAGALDASRQVKFANFASTLASTMASGSQGYNRLPNGKIEMFGIVNVPSSAGAAVTFPVAVTQVESVSVTSMVAGNSAGLNVTGWSGTGMTISATSAYPGGSASWRVVGRV